MAIEAAGCGKPVVGFNVTGLRDAVVNGQMGLLVEPGNVETLTNAMQRMFENAGLRHRLGGAARERAREFTWERAAESYESLCEEVVSRS